MKKILMLIATIVMILSISSVAFANTTDILASTPMLIYANDSIKVQQDGEYIDFADENGDIVDPQIINGRTMVPFRKIFNSLGVVNEDITWIDETKTVIAQKDNVTIELQINNNVAKKTTSGETVEMILDSAPVIINGRTMVPARFIAESMGKKVGWDDANRTVIIIDEEKLNNELNNSIPKYMEILSLQTTQLKNFDITVDLGAKIDYTDKENKANNTNIKLDGKMDIVKSDDAIYMDLDLDLELSGKGVMYDAIKDTNLEEIKLTMILAGNKVYLKSPLLQGSAIADKWMMAEDDSISELFVLLETTYDDPTTAFQFAIQEENLNITTYSNSKMFLELLKEIFKDENIKISGTSTKKYEITIDFVDLLKFMTNSDVEISNANKAKMKVSGAIKNGVAETGNVVLELEIVEDTEKIAVEIEANSKLNSYNKTYKINVPNEKDIISE